MGFLIRSSYMLASVADGKAEDEEEDRKAGGCLCVQSQLSPTLEAPWTIAHQAPLSMGFSRQEYWSGLPRPPPGDLPDPRIKLASLTL